MMQHQILFPFESTFLLNLNSIYFLLLFLQLSFVSIDLKNKISKQNKKQFLQIGLFFFDGIKVIDCHEMVFLKYFIFISFRQICLDLRKTDIAGS